jgi:hypothetical protein
MEKAGGTIKPNTAYDLARHRDEGAVLRSVRAE